MGLPVVVPFLGLFWIIILAAEIGVATSSLERKKKRPFLWAGGVLLVLIPVGVVLAGGRI